MRLRIDRFRLKRETLIGRQRAPFELGQTGEGRTQTQNLNTPSCFCNQPEATVRAAGGSPPLTALNEVHEEPPHRHPLTVGAS